VVVKVIKDAFGGVLTGWRKIEKWRKLVKRQFTKASNIHRKKGNNYQPRLKSSVKDYIRVCKTINKKINDSELVLRELAKDDPILEALLEQLKDYQQMLVKHIDLTERRILKGEQIPHDEKIFSIFERHVEWISKGKQHKKVELGHRVLVSRDQWGFIVDHKTIFGQQDVHLVMALTDRLQERFVKGDTDNYVIQSHSFDRG